MCLKKEWHYKAHMRWLIKFGFRYEWGLLRYYHLAQAGDNIVMPQLYGGTYTQFNDILPKLGISVKFVDSNDPEAFANAIDDKTRALLCETVSNPALEITDPTRFQQLQRHMEYRSLWMQHFQLHI